MDYKELIHRLINELSFRVGVPDLKDKEQQTIISEILSDWGNLDEKKIIMEFLTEDKVDPEQKVDYVDKDGNKQSSLYKNAIKGTKDSPQYKAAVKFRTDGTTPDETSTATAFSGKEGDAYRANLADGDSAKPKKEKNVGSNGSSEEDSPTNTEEQPKVSMTTTIDRGGDSKVKNEAFKYGFKEITKNGKVIFKPAPGNAGSLLNEVVSGEVAQMLEEDPNLSDEELIKLLKDRFGNTELFKSKGKNGNSGNQVATGIKSKEIPKGENKGLHSKLILAVRSGRRKHTKSVESAEQQGFKNSKIENYYGHLSSFDAMVNDIKDKQVIGPNGEEISQKEAEQLIRSGGRGDNPSDTATLVFDKDSNKVIMLFHSDKDSTSAIVAQSSLKAEAKANEENVDKLVQNGKLTQEQGDALKKDQLELVQKNNEIETELKKVVSGPAKHFLENVDIVEALKSVKNNTNPDGSKDSNATSTKFGGDGKTAGVKSKENNVVSSVSKYLPDGVDSKNATDEQALTAFFKFMSDENKGVDKNGNEIEPTEAQVTLMERLNTRFLDRGAPDIFSQIEDVRNRTLQLQKDFITKQDNQTVEIKGKPVGLGTYLEGSTVFKQFHLEAINPNSEKGVHKYPGMFETNHAGLAVDGETLKGCLGGDVENKEDFLSGFEVGEVEEQLGVSGSQKGKTTGGKRMVYAITSDNRKIEIGEKVMRTKTGKTGKLQTVYQWSDDMKKCFAGK